MDPELWVILGIAGLVLVWFILGTLEDGGGER